MPDKQYQLENPEIQLVDDQGEVTLFIDGEQAMQAWEKALMCRAAEILCQFGSEFIEVGLGLGLSALHIANHPSTHKHKVVEKYQRVIDLFYEKHKQLPGNLEIVHADFWDYVDSLDSSSVDGIFFDPALPKPLWDDREFWANLIPKMVRILKPGGAFVPFFTTEPVLWKRYVPYFDRIIIEKHPFTSYSITNYLEDPTGGTAFIQCFIKGLGSQSTNYASFLMQEEKTRLRIGI